MSAVAKAVRDQIATYLEALTPPSDTAQTYRQALGRSLEGNRMFAVLPELGGDDAMLLAGATRTQARFRLAVRISTAGLGYKESFDAFYDEGELIRNTLNTGATWPAGTHGVICGAYEREDVDSDDYLINFPVTAELTDTDGVS